MSTEQQPAAVPMCGTAAVLRVNLVGLAKLLELSARDSLLSDFQANFQAESAKLEV